MRKPAEVIKAYKNMGIYRILRNNIRTLMDSLTGFQVIYSRPTFVFDGFPAAFIVPVSNDNNFQTQNENERVYTFRIWSFVEYDTTGADNAYNTLMDLLDDVINKIDHEEDPESVARTMATSIPAGYTLLAVMAAPGEIVPDEEHKLLAGEVIVRCKVLVDLTLLS